MKQLDPDNIVIYQPGEIIIRKGDKAEKAYMVMSGKVKVFLENEGKIVDLAHLEQDEIFGETAIFQNSEYSASVKALEETELYIITPESLNEKLRHSDPIVRAMLTMLIDRLTKTNKKLLESETREFIDIAFYQPNSRH